MHLGMSPIGTTIGLPQPRAPEPIRHDRAYHGPGRAYHERRIGGATTWMNDYGRRIVAGM